MKLEEKYPPSESCSCKICQDYCLRPGWWTAEEAQKAMEAGYAGRMMLELSPRERYGVLSPAFKGNEGFVAIDVYSKQGCTFYIDGLCELFGTGLQPLECRFCHHKRKGMGLKCHEEIGASWNNPDAQKLIVHWGNITGFWRKQGYILTPR